MAPKFPLRTLVLMTLTLLSFAWFWWQTHLGRTPAPAAEAEKPPRSAPLPVELAPLGGDR